MSSRHTPYIVIPQGVFASPGAVLFKAGDTEDPLYYKYAEGSLQNMKELANRLNYIEAEKHNEVAVAADPVDVKAVGIPTAPETLPADIRLEAVTVALARADEGRINLVEFKRRVQAAVHSEDLLG